MSTSNGLVSSESKRPHPILIVGAIPNAGGRSRNSARTLAKFVKSTSAREIPSASNSGAHSRASLTRSFPISPAAPVIHAKGLDMPQKYGGKPPRSSAQWLHRIPRVAFFSFTLTL